MQHAARAPSIKVRLCAALNKFRRLGLTAVLASVTGVAALVTSPSLAGGSVARVAAGRAIDDKYFEPGSCVEFAPTAGDRHLTVFLDAGHGGIDPGGVGETESGQTIYEEDETLPVELDTAKLLEAKGFTVVVSRTGNQLVGRPRPGDVSDGILTVQGDHDDVATPRRLRQRRQGESAARHLLRRRWLARQRRVRDRLRRRPTLRGAEPPVRDAGPERRARRHERPGLGHPESRRDQRHRAGRTGPRAPRRRTTATCCSWARASRAGSTRRARCRARSSSRSSSPTRSRAASPSSASGQQVIAGGLAQAVEQYFSPPATGKNSEKGDPGRRHTEKDQRRLPAA